MEHPQRCAAQPTLSPCGVGSGHLAAVRAGVPARARALGFALGLVAVAPLAQAINADFTERWIDASQTLVLRIDADEQAQWRRWRLFLGTSDVTALTRLAAPGAIEIVPLATAWAAGEGELVVYDSQDWSERARLAVRVLGAGGFETSEHTPRLDLQFGGRAVERRNADAPPSEPASQGEVGLAAGGSWRGTRNGLSVEAALNINGSSNRSKALRAAELGARAPKIDLADYRLALVRERYALELGHIGAGTHPLLAQGLVSRGLGLRGPLGAQADVSLHVLGGTAIVGWDHLTGIEQADHQLRLLTLGAELLPSRAGGLRAELSVLDASLRSRGGFNIGTVSDAERSSGLGLRLLGASEGGRVQGELAWARSRFVNPFDPELALDGELQSVNSETRDAVLAALKLVVLQQAPFGGQAVDLSLDLRHERAQPLYRSLAASSVTPDQALTRAGLQAGIAGASAQLQLATRVDNLDRVATLLRTRTDELNLAFALPLAQWWGRSGQPGPWPSLGLSGQRVHQRAVNAPATEDSGFAASQRPDQLDTAQQLSLAWTLPAGSLSYGLTRSQVDNRQSGRERADFRRLAHQLSLDSAWGESLRAALSLTRSRELSVETGLVNWRTGGTLQIDWQPSERWAISASVAHEAASDSLDLVHSADDGAQLQLTRHFALPGIAKPQPGQLFVRLGRQEQRQRDTTFDQQIDLRSWWVDLGLSLSFF